jgi:hypothetical protein
MWVSIRNNFQMNLILNVFNFKWIKKLWETKTHKIFAESVVLTGYLRIVVQIDLLFVFVSPARKYMQLVEDESIHASSVFKFQFEVFIAFAWSLYHCVEQELRMGMEL